ncbi:MAG: Dyp-type peroxidase [Polyangiaceae bacterium]|nr:Dyp-type peroxidase [Polyangiaceae bacterium]
MKRADLQAIVASGFGDRGAARYVFVRARAGSTPEEVRAELAARALPHVVSIESNKPHAFAQLAFGPGGLRAIGLDDEELDTFPREFVQGMAHPERARVNGDRVDEWHLGRGGLDVLIAVFAGSDGAALALERAMLDGARHLERACEPLVASRLPDQTEHFGFRDGVSQPSILGVHGDPRGPERPVPTGEFVMGYENVYGQLPAAPSLSPARGVGLPESRVSPGRRDLGDGGAYLVLRKLEQDVFAWRAWLREASRPLAGYVADPEAYLGAKVVGRWASGAPLVTCPRADDPAHATKNDFDYDLDLSGLACPRGAHIRRTNPRGALPPSPPRSRAAVETRRLVRRGRPYGPPAGDAPDGEARGLVFVCLCANLARQFEFVQQTWVEGVKFDGGWSEDDPLVGARRAGADRFTIPRDPVRYAPRGLPRFVTARGGGYFFLPGMDRLRWLLGARG